MGEKRLSDSLAEWMGLSSFPQLTDEGHDYWVWKFMAVTHGPELICAIMRRVEDSAPEPLDGDNVFFLLSLLDPGNLGDTKLGRFEMRHWMNENNYHRWYFRELPSNEECVRNIIHHLYKWRRRFGRYKLENIRTAVENLRIRYQV